MAETVERNEDGFTVDAAVIAEGLQLEASEVPDMLRTGAIVTAHERGSREDEGRHRLTFMAKDRRLQLIVDDSGTILSRAARSADDDARLTD